MKLKFQVNDFKDFRSFEKAVKRQFGETTYVGTDSMVIVVEYPKLLKDMLRPFTPAQQIEFEIDSDGKQLLLKKT